MRRCNNYIEFATNIINWKIYCHDHSSLSNIIKIANERHYMTTSAGARIENMNDRLNVTMKSDLAGL